MIFFRYAAMQVLLNMLNFWVRFPAVSFEELTLQQAPSWTMIASNSSRSGGNFSHFPPKREYNFCPKVLRNLENLNWNGIFEMICTWNPKQPIFNGCLVKQPFPIM